ncbi:MAG: hypothetical protein WA118_09645 [Carboxydocellales bacterium]
MKVGCVEMVALSCLSAGNKYELATVITVAPGSLVIGMRFGGGVWGQKDNPAITGL